MRRRQFLAATALGAASGLAGCASLGGSGGAAGSPTSPSGGSGSSTAPFEHAGSVDASFAANGDYPADGSPADGYPPEFPDRPPRPDADPSSFRTLSVNGETVRLAPIDVVEAWYRRGEARFVDARGLPQYERSHVYGAVLSTAQQGSTGGVVDDWPAGDRVVTYCGCPHHLSSLRAAGLQKAGYSRVFALDEGFGEWSKRGYPMAGTSFASGETNDLAEWTLSGAVPSRHAGEYVWAAADRQFEAAPVRADGSFTLHLRFAGVTGETPVRVTTPAYTVTRPLGALAEGTIGPD